LLQEKLQAFDEFMIDQGVKNSKVWFKADLSRDVIKAFYTPMIKFSKDKEGNLLPYPPTIKLKLRRTNDQFNAKFYDKTGTPHKDISVEDLIVKGANLTVIMECRSVWFSGSKYGVTWQAKQIAIDSKMGAKIGDFAFKGLKSITPAAATAADEIDDDEVFQAVAPPRSVVSAFMPQPVAAAAAAVTPAAAATPMAAADDDDEDGEDMEPVPPPKPIVKKKVVTAKK
jgi:hypothetical protein